MTLQITGAHCPYCNAPIELGITGYRFEAHVPETVTQVEVTAIAKHRCQTAP